MTKQTNNVETVTAKIYSNVQNALELTGKLVSVRSENIKLLDSIKADWEAVPTFDPSKPQNADRPKLDIAINNIRLGIQKLGMSFATGKVAKNVYDEWAQLRALKKTLATKPDTDEADKASGAGKAKKSPLEMYAVRSLMFADYLAGQVKQGLTTTEAELAPLVREINKVLIKHGVKVTK